MKSVFNCFLLAVAVIIMSCQQPKGVTISGNLLNTSEAKVFLAKKTFQNAMESVGDVAMTKGKFSYNVAEGLDPGLYRLRVGSKGIDLIIDGTEKNIDITGDYNDLNKYSYTITGSTLSEEFRGTINDLINQNTTRQEIEKKTETADPLLGVALSLGTMPATPSKHAAYKKLSDRLSSSYAGSDIATGYAEYAANMKMQYDKQMNKYKVKLGQDAPDIVMADTKGQTKKLSDLKGNVVLLDFWASWCGPCRRANPHVVETYHKYKDKGFTVFSVSLDGMDTRRMPANLDAAALEKQNAAQKKRWMDAIAKDQLVWDTHVSELKKWQCSAAKDYGVSSIPTTFLIDKEGKIAALNPRNNLEEEIIKLI